MNAKIIASLAFTSMFSLSTLLSPAHAEEQEKALNFGIISTESQQNLKPNGRHSYRIWRRSWA